MALVHFFDQGLHFLAYLWLEELHLIGDLVLHMDTVVHDEALSCVQEAYLAEVYHDTSYSAIPLASFGIQLLEDVGLDAGGTRMNHESLSFYFSMGLKWSCFTHLDLISVSIWIWNQNDHNGADQHYDQQSHKTLPAQILVTL